ncbi:MAG: hypothetical protein PHE53_09320 [Thermoguttaceae bacterium]|nr:hypothetical protein [Thermoguttaceae bacterium]
MAETPITDARVIEVRKLVWRDVLPEVIFGRCFGIAFQLRAMFLGFWGIQATIYGWQWFREILVCSTPQNPPIWNQPPLRPSANFWDFPALAQNSLDTVSGVLRVWHQLLFDGISQSRLDLLAQAMIFSLYLIVVWSLIGGLLTRSAALQLATYRRDSLTQTVRFVIRKWVSYLGTAILPVLAMSVIAAILIFIGWSASLMNDTLTAWLSAVLGWFPLFLGFLGTIFLVGTMFGFPLMVAAVSAEGTDAFDGTARGFHFLLRRPLRVFVYVILVSIVGLLGMGIVRIFFHYFLAYTQGFIEFAKPNPMRGTTVGELIHSPWLALIPTLVTGFSASFFWSTTTAIYLLLRKNIDHTPLDQVLAEEESAEPPKKLPIIRKDAAGAPVMDPMPDGKPVDDIPKVDREEGVAPVSTAELAAQKTESDASAKPSAPTEKLP